MLENKIPTFLLCLAAVLAFFVAGTRGADIVIPGLPLYYAEALRDRLKNYSPEDAV